MNLDGLFLDNMLINEKLRNFLALVTLELNDVTELGMLDNGAVAAKILLEHFENFFEIHLLGNATGGGEGLATVALLNANVNKIGRCSCSFIQFIRCKRVCASRQKKRGHNVHAKVRNSAPTRESDHRNLTNKNLPNVAVLSKSSAIKLFSFDCFLCCALLLRGKKKAESRK